MTYDRLLERSNRRSVLKCLGASSVAGLAGCLGGDEEVQGPDDGESDGAVTDGSSDATEVVFWEYFGGTEQSEVQSLVEEFNSTHDDIQVEMSNVPFENFFDAVFTAVASEEAPHVTTYWGSFSNFMVQEGAIDPIDEYMEVSLDDYYESARPAMTVDGSTYALPMDVHGLMLVSNDTVLDEAGVDEVPQDWETFRQACNAIQENTDAKPFALLENGSSVAGMRAYFSVLQQQSESSLVEQTDDGWDVVYDQTDGGLNALDFLDTVTGNEWDSTDLSDDQERLNEFRNNELGFFLGGNFHINFWQDENDELPDDLELTYSKPFVFSGSENGTFGESTGFFFPADSSHTEEQKQAAVRFAEWITQNNPLWAQTAGHLPAAIEVGESDEVRNSRYYREDGLGIVSTLEDMASNGELVQQPRIPADLYSTGVAQPLVDVYAQNKDPEQALQESADALRERLS